MDSTKSEQKPLPINLIVVAAVILICVAAVACVLLMGGGTSAPTETAQTPTPGSTTVSPANSPASSTSSTPSTTNNDPVIGTWSGTKTISLILVSYNGEGTVTFNPDYSAHASGFFQGPGLDKTFAIDFTWENLGNNQYRGYSSTKSLDFSLADNVLTMIVNPKKFGVTDLLDMDIDILMRKV